MTWLVTVPMMQMKLTVAPVLLSMTLVVGTIQETLITTGTGKRPCWTVRVLNVVYLTTPLGQITPPTQLDTLCILRRMRWNILTLQSSQVP